MSLIVHLTRLKTKRLTINKKLMCQDLSRLGSHPALTLHFSFLVTELRCIVLLFHKVKEEVKGTESIKLSGPTTTPKFDALPSTVPASRGKRREVKYL